MNRRRTSKRILATRSTRSVKRQRPRHRKTSRRATRWIALDRLRARLGRSIDRWAERTSDRATDPGTPLVGLDITRLPSRLRTSSWGPVAIAIVGGALFLAFLRIDVIRMGFTLARTFDDTSRLEELKRELTVDMRQLRDPAALIRHARELGFRRAERLIELDGNGPVHRPSAVEEPAGAIELVSASPRRPLGENP